MSYCDQLDKPIETTMYGLQKWRKSKFKKLGWMFLAMHKHNLIKNVQQYHCGLVRLRDSLVAKKVSLSDAYKKDDIEILLSDVDILINFCSNNIMGGSFNLMGINPLDITTIDPRFPLDSIDVTTCGLCGWYKHCFEKLGWMLLAKYKYKLLGKIDHYYYGLIILAKSIKTKHDKLSSYGETDKVRDFKIMLENVIMLVNFVNATLMKNGSMSGGRRRTSKKTMAKTMAKTMSAPRKASKRGSKRGSKKMSRIVMDY